MRCAGFREERMKDKITGIGIWLGTSLALVLADQYTKLLATAHLRGQQPYVVIDGVFELLYSENRGAAFGMMQGKQAFFFVVALAVFAAAAYAMWRMPPWSNRRYHGLKICAIMITAGALGNMVDRVTLGYVVDFFYFSLIDFPIFNVADIYVTTATAVLLVLICFFYKEEELECFQWRRGRSGKDEEEQD